MPELKGELEFMDWIEFVSKHSGSPFAPKMRHWNIGKEDLAQKLEQASSTLSTWLKETEKQITLRQAWKIKEINTALATVVER